MGHLKGIGIKNFRVFEKETYFDFTKINVLTGPNNSGKSSLLKLLLLLRKGDLDINYGEHNLGDVDSFLNYKSKDDKLTITFIIEKTLKVLLLYKKKNSQVLSLAKIELIDALDGELIISSDQQFNFRKLHIISLNVRDMFLKRYAEKKDKIIEKHQDMDIHKWINNLKSYDPISTLFEYNSEMGIKSIEDEFEFLDKHFHFPNEQELNKTLFEYSKYESGYEMEKSKLNGLSDLNRYYFEDNNNPKYKKFAENNLKDLDKFIFLKNVYCGNIKKTKKSDDFFTYISLFFEDISIDKLTGFTLNHLKAIRAPQKRVYFTENNNEVFVNLLINFKRIDFDLYIDPFEKTEGTLRNLLGVQNDLYLDDQFDLKFINSWIKKFEIGEEISFEIKEGKLLFPYVVRKNIKVNVSDLGYGYSQLIAILFKILLTARIKYYKNKEEGYREYRGKEILYIEEPEVNLHPAFQSKLADMFVEASQKFNIQFIIETHSEYLIRKLQYLTAKKELDPKDSVIYYFHHPDKIPTGEEQIKKLEILEDGSLTGDFGPGFFDEATNLKFELLKLKNPQKN